MKNMKDILGWTTTYAAVLFSITEINAYLTFLISVLSVIFLIYKIREKHYSTKKIKKEIKE